jgi:geranylgeranyl diphosphate synthase type I
MSPRTEKAMSAAILEDFRKRSTRGLELVRSTLLAEGIKSAGIRAALEYYTSNWVDFIHPGLFSLACEAVGGSTENAVKTQASIVMMTDAFDIHDDIIDGSTVKHGKPTVFGKFGKEVALLLGNAFLVRGFTLLSESIEDIPKHKRERIFKTLEKSLFEVGNAHALELEFKRRTDLGPEQFMPVLEMKAASFEADMRIAAVVGGGTDCEIEALSNYGRILGILVTLREDFVDVFELDELLQRMRNEYLPFPILNAFQNAAAKERVLRILSRKSVKSKEGEEIVAAVFETEQTEELKDYMRKLKKQLLRYVSKLKKSAAKLALRRLALAILEDL